MAAVPGPDGALPSSEAASAGLTAEVPPSQVLASQQAPQNGSQQKPQQHSQHESQEHFGQELQENPQPLREDTLDRKIPPAANQESSPGENEGIPQDSAPAATEMFPETVSNSDTQTLNLTDGTNSEGDDEGNNFFAAIHRHNTTNLGTPTKGVSNNSPSTTHPPSAERRNFVERYKYSGQKSRSETETKTMAGSDPPAAAPAHSRDNGAEVIDLTALSDGSGPEGNNNPSTPRKRRRHRYSGSGSSSKREEKRRRLSSSGKKVKKERRDKGKEREAPPPLMPNQNQSQNQGFQAAAFGQGNALHPPHDGHHHQLRRQEGPWPLASQVGGTNGHANMVGIIGSNTVHPPDVERAMDNEVQFRFELLRASLPGNSNNPRPPRPAAENNGRVPEAFRPVNDVDMFNSFTAKVPEKRATQVVANVPGPSLPFNPNGAKNTGRRPKAPKPTPPPNQPQAAQYSQALRRSTSIKRCIGLSLFSTTKRYINPKNGGFPKRFIGLKSSITPTRIGTTQRSTMLKTSITPRRRNTLPNLACHCHIPPHAPSSRLISLLPPAPRRRRATGRRATSRSRGKSSNPLPPPPSHLPARPSRSRSLSSNTHPFPSPPKRL
ncbi:hypothetical protein C8A05DRAFT_34581, partial [Staphylotrichum tortipilum]